MSISITPERQHYLRQLAEKCPDSLGYLKKYFSSYASVICPPYKKTRDPLAMKELTTKCPSCSHLYSTNSFVYRGKVTVNQHLHRILAIRRKYKRIPTANTYKRRLFENFTSRSRSKLLIKCFHCNETRRFDGTTRKELPVREELHQKVPTKVKTICDRKKFQEKFEKVSCQFLKKQSDLRAFLEQL